MNLFRTEVIPDRPHFHIGYRSNVFLIGSCFAQNMGQKLNNLAIPALINPFGVLYNPVSICQDLDILLSDKVFGEKDLEFYNNKWFSYHHYTGFSDNDKQACLKTINEALFNARGFLETCGILTITLGTSWAYRLIKNGQYVANCHKVPANAFEREFIAHDRISEMFSGLFDRLMARLPQLKIIFTLSPIRHWKDGATGNQVSKANLLLSIHELAGKYPNIHYFPSYEIMMDDLRDYRFYDGDMLHPSPVAIDYIWEKFMETYFSEEAIEISLKVNKLSQAANHRPSDPESIEYAEFVKKNMDQARAVEKQYGIRMDAIIKRFKKN
jgi:hypothetical protein